MAAERQDMVENNENKGEIIIYKGEDTTELRVSLVDESVWLTQSQMAELFDRNIPTINEHIKHVYKTGELSQNSVIRNFRITARDGKTYNVEHYNLDMIISIGYRVNSKRGTQFRIWATKHLHDYLLKGYLVNEKRLQENQQLKLKELEQANKLFHQVLESQRIAGYEKDLLKIITDYTDTWIILNQYDKEELEVENVSKRPAQLLDYDQAKKTIEKFKARLMKDGFASDLFGAEVGSKLKAALGNLSHTFGGKDLYPSIEEKAVHLFYFVIKDHPFVDGNKRIGALLFILFLVENHYLFNRKGERKISDSALTALALLIAESRPQQKDVMIKLIVNLINKK
jgi:prophage maintenance system killer protein